jgi:hypothetical protein
VEIGDRLDKLLILLETEFETHYLEINWIYKPKTKELFLNIDYPVTANHLVLAAKISRNIKKSFDFLEIEWVNKIYEFINEEAKKLDIKYGKQKRR